MGYYYGWISNSNTKNKINRGTGTDTAEYIKYYAINNGGASVADIQGIRSKNLLRKNNKNYYILSIGKTKTGWAPYPNILALKPELLLTIDPDPDSDSDKNKYKWWLLEGGKYDYSRLKLVSRENAGDYYSLSLSQLEKDQFTGGKEYVKKGENQISEIWKIITEGETDE